MGMTEWPLWRGVATPRAMSCHAERWDDHSTLIRKVGLDLEQQRQIIRKTKHRCPVVRRANCFVAAIEFVLYKRGTGSWAHVISVGTKRGCNVQATAA